MSDSIWKKEISFRRKSSDGEERSGKPESFWNKEISLGRRHARKMEIQELTDAALDQVAGNPNPDDLWGTAPELPPDSLPDIEVEPFVPAAPEQPSIWKREISLKRQPKEETFVDEPASLEAEPDAIAPEAVRKQGETRKVSRPKESGSSRARGGHPVKRVVGLKIGASQLAAARVANNGAAELLQVARQPLEQGVVVGGEVRDPEALAVSLKQFFARNKLPKKNVRLGIASNRIGVRLFDVDGIDDEKQLENAIRFRAQEALPIPLDEAVLDYHILGETTDDEGKVSHRVLLVVAYRELVERYVSACRKAGITLAGIDLEAFALLRALAAPTGDGAETDSALVAVAIGHDRSTFAVSDGNVCEFTRVIEWGGATLSIAIARALDVAPSEVENFKRLVALDSPDIPEGVSPDQYAHAVDAVRKQVQAFARELVSSLQFYQHQPGSLGIGEIVITGGTASLRGLAAELQSLIGVHVRVGDPLARLKVPKKLDTGPQTGSLAIAIGLGIED
jgi:type IV pilus assembly protein PilM